MRRDRKAKHKAQGRTRLPKISLQRDAVTSEIYFELEIIPGLAEFAQAELQELGGKQVHLLPGTREDRVRFRFGGSPSELLQLRRSVAVSRVKRFDIPRPKALLGHQSFEALMHFIQETLTLHKPGSFETFYISAAGSRSSVFTRIKEEIQARTGLQPVEEAGDLLLAVRRPQRLAGDTRSTAASWEVAIRLSPRPLSARSWRVCNMPGALNGTVANTMMGLTRPSNQDRVINLACGSGTLLIERLALGTVKGTVGCDIDARALACSRENLIASGNIKTVTLVQGDAGRVPLPDGWASAVCADLPFGMLVGSHQCNERLYPRLLTEAGRLTVAGGRLVVITQEVRLFERTAAAHKSQWAIKRVIPIKLPANTRAGYIHPRIYVLRRRKAPTRGS